MGLLPMFLPTFVVGTNVVDSLWRPVCNGNLYKKLRTAIPHALLPRGQITRKETA